MSVGDSWMVLESSRERVIHWGPSFLAACRVARRRSGGHVEVRRNGPYGLLVIGRYRAYLVVGAQPTPAAFSAHDRIPVAISVESRDRDALLAMAGRRVGATH